MVCLELENVLETFLLWQLTLTPVTDIHYNGDELKERMNTCCVLSLSLPSSPQTLQYYLWSGLINHPSAQI